MSTNPILRSVAPLRRMTGRDPHESRRVATPLELLLDLAFVVAFGIAGNEFAHLIADDHIVEGMAAFGLSVFAIIWAWINFTWFASAFDSDDWLYRLTTMVQMTGVTILALGLPDVFHSVTGDHLDNRVMVAGYIVMRVAMLAQWLRVAFSEPAYRSTALAYAGSTLLAQVGWTMLAWRDLPLWTTLWAAVGLVIIELSGPLFAENRLTATPWHAHHIAERYGLLTIITLGEGVIGTVAAVGTVVSEHGWSSEAVALVVSGIGLTFGMWWVYFSCRSGDLLHANRDRNFLFGYGHIVLLAAVAAVGAGLHVGAYVIEGKAHISTAAAVASVAGPVGCFLVVGYVIHSLVGKHWDRLQAALTAVSVAVAVGSVLLTRAGASMGTALLVTALAPLVVVAGTEVHGQRRARI